MTERERVESQIFILRAQRGEANAFEQLMQIWDQRLLLYLRKLLQNDELAWDAFQSVWIEAFRRLRQLRDPVAFPLWLFRIARGAASRHQRQLRSEELENTSASKEREHHDVGSLLEHASADQRRALELHYLEGLTIEEIAQFVGVPAGTVKSRLHSGRLRIRNSQEGESDDQ